MGKYLWIGEDRTLDWDDRSWITTSIIFNNIFNRVEKFFTPPEFECRDICYADRGMDGIYLNNSVSKECFNIFYLRCKQALAHYPDAEMLAWLDKFPDQPDKRNGYIYGISREWQEILKRLELDKRYDSEWIDSYLQKQGEIG